MRNKLFILFTLFLLFSTFIINGQSNINSPYSRFNIGSLERSGSFRSLAMGGLAVSMRDYSSIYFSNPASYSSFDTISFVFDFGIDYNRDKLINGSSTFTSEDVNFDHLLMGFPLAKGWGFTLGVVPYSNGFYKLNETINENDPGYNPSVGPYTSFHAGNGSLTNFFMGTGLKLTKNLSVGVNMTIMFGTLTRTNQTTFSDYSTDYHNTITESLQLGGVNFDYGLQYSQPLKNNRYINFGMSLTSGKNYNSTFDNIILRYTAWATRDTVSYVSQKGKNAFIPATFRIGISYVKLNELIVGLDYVTTKWSGSKIPSISTTNYAADTKSFIFGAEYIPDKFSNYSALKRLQYRIGGHFGDNYLIINNMQLKEYGASVGIGIPMKHLSMTNFFFDYTKKYGPGNSNFHTEDYYSIGVSLNLYDNWFMKRKYD